MQQKGNFCRCMVVFDFPGGLEVTVAKYGQVYTHLTRNFKLDAVVMSILAFETLFLSSCL